MSSMQLPDGRIFPTLAAYNTWVNNALAELLKSHPELCQEPETTYYGSILGLLSHLTLSDITWLRRLWSRDPISLRAQKFGR